MNIDSMQATAEAVLFASGEPLEIARVAEAIELDIEATEIILNNLSASLKERGSGLCVLKLAEKYQLCARTEYAEIIRSVLEIKRDTPLSSAAFAVLSAVAYNQPITKSYIEQVRGVDCSGVISTLCQKGLVEEKGILELPGRPLIYGTTPEFLRCFCLSSLRELPDLPEKGERLQGVNPQLEQLSFETSETEE